MDLTIDNWMVAWMPADSTPELDKLRGPRTPPNGAVKIRFGRIRQDGLRTTIPPVVVVMRTGKTAT